MKPFINAKFLISAEKLSQCPDHTLPEFPLLGRSNVPPAGGAGQRQGYRPH